MRKLTSMKLARAIVASLMLFSVFAVLTSPVPQVHAASPSIANFNGKYQTVGSTISQTLVVNNVGDIIIVGGASPSSVLASNPSDSYGDSFNVATSETFGGVAGTIVWYAYSKSSGTDTVTVTPGDPGHAGLGLADCVACGSILTAVNAGASGTMQVASFGASGDVGIAIYAASVNFGSWIGSSSGGTWNGLAMGSGAQFTFGQYVSPLSSATIADASGVNNGGWAEAAVLFGPPSGTCNHQKTCSLTTTVSSGAVAVVAVQCSNNCQGVTPFSSSHLSDSLGNVYTLQSQISTCNVIGPCAGNTSIASGIYTSPITVGGPDTITFAYVNGQLLISLEVAVVTGVSATPSCTATGGTSGSNTATSIQTSAICTNPGSGSIAFSSLAALGSIALVAGTGFTLTAPVVNQAMQTLTGQSGTTTFPASTASATGLTDAGIVLSASNAPTGTATIGSCPTKNTGTFTLVNNTEYIYTTSAIAGESVQSISTFVASVTSAAASETLYFGIYTSTGTTISATNPLVLGTSFSKSLTAGTTNNLVGWNAGFAIGVPTGATVAIAILGNSKIKINDSSFGGLFTGTTSGGLLASSLTSITSVGTQLYFCASLNYQVIATTTVVSTTTATTTSTTTNNGGQGGSTNPFLYLALAIIMAPFMIGFKYAGLGGGMFAGSMGVLVSIVGGLIPPVYFVMVLVMAVAAIFMPKPGGGGGV